MAGKWMAQKSWTDWFIDQVRWLSMGATQRLTLIWEVVNPICSIEMRSENLNSHWSIFEFVDSQWVCRIIMHTEMTIQSILRKKENMDIQLCSNQQLCQVGSTLHWHGVHSLNFLLIDNSFSFSFSFWDYNTASWTYREALSPFLMQFQK